ncbi:flagellar basal body-associated FliL family protein [Bradyrhizobium diazoefficiens]|jgi:flagellar FliL protein|nr:flagellar basal body-associated FliL family protein [Bradyrhizobium diazoefficiens]UCF52618.1 MAG: flagellar basal body-associated FliL family protein [Bradyrhizobium sp.]MBR0968554.1 flagellar basal body-associated FliL family protein [Bradyrhizobium diazoefficiens]MBR0976381.1 flagellar basal body-associated FliL family protein [Bradyrhizobium diazoefficiens]MBR1011328.1 flagellar basal body-associated FliL family protein [Bradyrhizobium diazoefficiens]MBR1013340.1 flagellar basal body-as
MRLIAAILVLTLVAIGAGALAGLHLFAAAERVADAKKTATPPLASSYAGSARLRKLSPIVTNLAAPANNWARVEASMVTESMSDEDAGILAAHISEDIVTYLRSATVGQFEGARGLQHLRDDLAERANIRSSGKVRELIIETLVIQ